MKNRKNNLILAFLLLSIFSCKERKSIKILSLKQFDTTDSLRSKEGVISYHRTENFIVENNYATLENKKFLDSVGKAPLAPSLKNFQDFQRIFYKSSDQTNLKALKENPRDLVRYSQNHDLISIYYFSKGKFLFKQEWSDGEIVNSDSNIKVKVH